jgi:hypothetical protein
MAELGIPVEELLGLRRSLACTCLDWTERRPHLAGALGAALAARMLDLGWLERRKGTRALRLTQPGENALLERGWIAPPGRSRQGSSE